MFPGRKRVNDGAIFHPGIGMFRRQHRVGRAGVAALRCKKFLQIHIDGLDVVIRYAGGFAFPVYTINTKRGRQRQTKNKHDNGKFNQRKSPTASTSGHVI